eukprot:m.25094 g.25094  ORF g.25094 m.25094 type:complete len:271 (+) comp14874_c0_seq1:254-1066(+)
MNSRVSGELNHTITTCLQEQDDWFATQKFKLRNQELVAEVKRLRKRLGPTSEQEEKPICRDVASQTSIDFNIDVEKKELEALLTEANEKITKMLATGESAKRKISSQTKKLSQHTVELASHKVEIEKQNVDLKTKSVQLLTLKRQLHQEQQRTRVETPPSPKRTGFVMHPDKMKLNKLAMQFEQLWSEKQKIEAAYNQLKAENKGMMSEIGALDQEFFEELEDLKFSYQQSTRLNNVLETALRDMASRFNIGLPLDCVAMLNMEGSEFRV